MDTDLARQMDPKVKKPANNPHHSTIDKDLSQSLTSILAGVPGLNTHPQVGLDIISTCTDS